MSMSTNIYICKQKNICVNIYMFEYKYVYM
jgi:hypothetical protein